MARLVDLALLYFVIYLAAGLRTAKPPLTKSCLVLRGFLGRIQRIIKMSIHSIPYHSIVSLKESSTQIIEKHLKNTWRSTVVEPGVQTDSSKYDLFNSGVVELVIQHCTRWCIFGSQV